LHWKNNVIEYEVLDDQAYDQACTNEKNLASQMQSQHPLTPENTAATI
jgi:hypothetical protein